MTVTSAAHAEPDVPRSIDLRALVDRGLQLLTPAKTKSGLQDAPRDARAAAIAEQDAMFPSRDVALRDSMPDPVGSPTFGFGRPRSAVPSIVDNATYAEPPPSPPHGIKPALHATLVARDWKGGMSLAGVGMLPTDHVRLARSMRMLVARLTVGDGRLVPFFHFGAGEWRYDPDLLPYMPRNQEYAAQFSAGMRLRLAERAVLAWEADYTVLCRERREPQNLPTPRVLSSFAVLQLGF
jgi:hypothetical protein